MVFLIPFYTLTTYLHKWDGLSYTLLYPYYILTQICSVKGSFLILFLLMFSFWHKDSKPKFVIHSYQTHTRRHNSIQGCSGRAVSSQRTGNEKTRMNFKEPWQRYPREESKHFHCKPTERKTNKLDILIYLGAMLVVSKKFILKLFIHFLNNNFCLNWSWFWKLSKGALAL